MTDRDPIAEAVEELRKREAGALIDTWTGGTEAQAQEYLKRRGIEVINFARIDNQTYTRAELMEMLKIDHTGEQFGADELSGKEIQEDVIFLRIRRTNEPIDSFVKMQLAERGYRPADIDETLAALHEVGFDSEAEIGALSSIYKVGSGESFHPAIVWHADRNFSRPMIGLNILGSSEKLDIVPVVLANPKKASRDDVIETALKAVLRKQS